MKVIPLLSGITTAVPGSVVAINAAGPRARSEVAQVSITGGTATVNIEGRLNASFAWAVMATLSTDGDAKEVVVLPFMRGNVTAISGATVGLSISGG